MSVSAGTYLDQRYRLIERLAVGGMGQVWQARDETLDRDVAVKILRSELGTDDAFRRRFRAEARTAGGLPHNGIAAVFDYGETTVAPDGTSPAPDTPGAESIAYLVMELVPGESLSAILLRERRLSPQRTLAIVAQSARALHAAHQRGVVHRDVKPANLMVTPEGRVKVTDFGIARPVDHEPLTMTGQVMGTAHYLAPELARGLDASAASDVYALGVVAYECLAGRRPFEGDNQVLVATAHLSQEPPPLPHDLPNDVVAVVTAAMDKEPTQRFATAQDLAVAAERVLAGLPWTPSDSLAGAATADASTTVLDPAAAPPTMVTGPPAPPPPPTYALTPYQQRPTQQGEGAQPNRWPLVLGGLVFAVLLLGFLVWQITKPPETSPIPSVSPSVTSRITGTTTSKETSTVAPTAGTTVRTSNRSSNTQPSTISNVPSNTVASPSITPGQPSSEPSNSGSVIPPTPTAPSTNSVPPPSSSPAQPQAWGGSRGDLSGLTGILQPGNQQ